MITDERVCRHDVVMRMVEQMMIAGRTAPKAKGVDLIEIVALTDEQIVSLSDAMRMDAEHTGMKFFLRDADNLMQAETVILVGTRPSPMALNCGQCGYATCAEKMNHAGVPCAINSLDLGIAIGSMTSRAADMRLDTRVMFSAGYSAHRIGVLTDCPAVYAIAVSASSKNPFFDRQTTR